MKQTVPRLLQLGTLALALVCASCGGPEESELATAQNLEVGTTGTLTLSVTATDETGAPLPSGRYNVGIHARNLPAPGPGEYTGLADGQRIAVVVDFGGLRVFQWVALRKGSVYTVDTTGPDAKWGDWPMTEAAETTVGDRAEVFVRFKPLRVLIDATDENGALLPNGRYSISFGGYVLSGPRYYGHNEPAPANIAIAHHGRLALAVDFGGLRAYQTITFQSGQGLIVDTTGPTARWGDWPTLTATAAPDKEAHIHFRFLPLTLVVEAVTPDFFHIPHSASAHYSTFGPGPLYFKRLTTAPAVTHHGAVPVYVIATEGPQTGFRVYQSFVAKERQRYTIDATQGGNYSGNWPITSDTLSYGKTLVVRVIFTHSYGLQSVPALSQLLSAMDPEHDPLPPQVPFETESMYPVPAE